jgi:hypothetical protein
LLLCCQGGGPRTPGTRLPAACGPYTVSFRKIVTQGPGPAAPATRYKLMQGLGVGCVRCGYLRSYSKALPEVSTPRRSGRQRSTSVTPSPDRFPDRLLVVRIQVDIDVVLNVRHIRIMAEPIKLCFGHLGTEAKQHMPINTRRCDSQTRRHGRRICTQHDRPVCPSPTSPPPQGARHSKPGAWHGG